MYPIALREDVVDDLHGVRIADPYRWLEDPGSGPSQAWIEAQDELFRSYADALPALPFFTERLSTLERAGLAGPPAEFGGRSFRMVREPDQQHMVLHVIEPDGTRRVLVDPHTLDESHRTVLDVWQVSPDGRLLVYLTSTGGTEESVLHVLDVATGDIVDGPIDRCRNSTIAWTPDSSAFYFVRRLPPADVPDGEQQYHRRVYLHVVGKDQDQDALVFGDGLDKATHIRVQAEHGWLVISTSRGGHPGNDLWVADLSAAVPVPTPLQLGVPARTSLRIGANGLGYLLTARDAPRGKIMVKSLRGYGPSRELIAEENEAVLADALVLGDTLVVNRRRHAASELTRYDARTGEPLGPIPLPGVGTVGGLTADGDAVIFGYTDLTTPLSALRYDPATGTTSVWAPAPGAVELPAMTSEAVEFRSADGTGVRMIVLSRTGLDGPRPCILTGYGGFGIPMVPGYNPQALAWVAAGGVYAIVQARGGGERGARWHRAGTGPGKQRVVEDFHAAARTLVAEGWTTAARLAVSGGSNGGLIVAAAAVQRPDLFRAVVSASPLLDMVRYERSGLGASWRSEYGSASEPEQLRWLLRYSPYHHVTAGTRYPAVLLSVADADARVDPFHARKMCAALQWATTNAAPVLLRTDRDTGHAARAVTGSVTMNAEILAFCADQTGLTLES